MTDARASSAVARVQKVRSTRGGPPTAPQSQTRRSGGSARGYLALSKLSAVGESRMPRADDGWRARPAAGTGCIPGSPTALLAGSPW